MTQLHVELYKERRIEGFRTTTQGPAADGQTIEQHHFVIHIDGEPLELPINDTDDLQDHIRFARQIIDLRSELP